jgi:hypothetical protein
MIILVTVFKTVIGCFRAESFKNSYENLFEFHIKVLANVFFVRIFLKKFSLQYTMIPVF